MFDVMIKLRRKQLGLTQAQLARKVEVTTKYISHMETGTIVPSFEMMTELGKALILNPRQAEAFSREWMKARIARKKQRSSSQGNGQKRNSHDASSPEG